MNYSFVYKLFHLFIVTLSNIEHMLLNVNLKELSNCKLKLIYKVLNNPEKVEKMPHFVFLCCLQLHFFIISLVKFYQGLKSNSYNCLRNKFIEKAKCIAVHSIFAKCLIVAKFLKGNHFCKLSSTSISTSKKGTGNADTQRSAS